MALREGFDYGAGPIPPSVIKNAGRDFVVRYVHPGKWTQMFEPEYRQIVESGLDICGVWQMDKSRALSGSWGTGRADMLEAMSYVRSIGGPDNAVIYIVANDYDRLTATQHAAVKTYIDGAVSARGRALTGAYGDYYTIDYLGDTCAYYWQTKSWSDGKWHPRANLQQYQHDVALGSYWVDYTRAMTADFGQWTNCDSPFAELFGKAGC